MAIAVVAHTSAASGDTNNVSTTGQNTSGANFGICVAADYDQATVPLTVTDNKNAGNWIARTAYSSTSGGVREQLFYIANPNVGSGHIVTASGTFGFPAIATLWLSGVNSNPFDVESGNGNTLITLLQVGATVPTVDAFEISVSGCGWTISGTNSIDQGYTITDQTDYVAGVNFGIALAYLLNTPLVGTNPTWTLGNPPRDLAASNTIFKAAVVGAITRRGLAVMGVGQ